NITFFTVVPTVYNRLLLTFSDLPPETQTAAKTGIAPNNLRLAISGSAALPTPTRKAWTDLSSGNVLLERYGMTEVGMALSCGLSHATRIDGSVGFPLPSVQVRLVDTDTNEIIRPGEEIDASGKERDGEIQLRGPTIFSQYWRNEKATRDEHVAGDDGLGPWFKTGDVAVRRTIDTSSSSSSSSSSPSLSSSSSSSNSQDEAQAWAQGPMYFIRGRKSADIIKSGGEKVSALEVEREMLALPQIAETAVVAVPSGNWGQKVGAVVMLKEGVGRFTALDLRRALKGTLAGYKIPQVMKVVDHIPRNAMGKSTFFHYPYSFLPFFLGFGYGIMMSANAD
ncbi:Acyl-CoA synthetase family member 3, mitochondrial, partial [Lachnellula willkommii]